MIRFSEGNNELSVIVFFFRNYNKNIKKIVFVVSVKHFYAIKQIKSHWLLFFIPSFIILLFSSLCLYVYFNLTHVYTTRVPVRFFTYIRIRKSLSRALYKSDQSTTIQTTQEYVCCTKVERTLLCRFFFSSILFFVFQYYSSIIAYVWRIHKNDHHMRILLSTTLFSHASF